MAITKIWNIGASKTGVTSRYLLNSLRYITNEDKTKGRTMVGSVNCMPIADMAYDQMLGTKKLFGKELGRQGYHMVIAFDKGETDTDTAYDIAEGFVDKFLKNEYECIYAVHDDKEHIHAHIIFNSVNMISGRKFSYKKGDWKHIIQPITNELCEKYDLSVMPALYALEKSNLPRSEYENLKTYREFIRADCEYAIGQARDMKQFVAFLRDMGYEVKEGMHIAVRLPGMKRFARIDTIDKDFSRENLALKLNCGITIKAFSNITKEIPYYQAKDKSRYAKKYHRQLRGMHAVTRYRFRYKPAWLYKAIKEFNRLQEEYLFLSKYNNIETADDLMTLHGTIEAFIRDIGDEQKKIYRMNAAYKRKCKSPEQIREYQILHHKNEVRLEQLKEKKKRWYKERDLLKRCYGRELSEVFDRIGKEWEDKVIDVPLSEFKDKTKEQEAKDYDNERAERFIEEYFRSGFVNKYDYGSGYSYRDDETGRIDDGGEDIEAFIASQLAQRAESERYADNKLQKRRDRESERADREIARERQRVERSQEADRVLSQNKRELREEGTRIR